MKVCILSIMKNEYPEYIQEWIEYHLGKQCQIDHIFIIDNNTEENAIVINNDKVTIFPYRKEFPKTFWFDEQIIAYNNIICNEILPLKEYDYMLTIDCDEYFYYKNGNIKDFIINEMIPEDITSAEIGWLTYDDNNIIYESEIHNTLINTYTHPQDSILQSYNIQDNIASGRKSLIKLFDKDEYKSNNIIHVHFPNYKTKTYNKKIFDDVKLCHIKHFRMKCLETFIKNKCKNQSFKNANTQAGNIIKAFFEINMLTNDKIDAFMELSKKHNYPLSRFELDYLEYLRNTIN